MNPFPTLLDIHDSLVDSGPVTAEGILSALNVDLDLFGSGDYADFARTLVTKVADCTAFTQGLFQHWKRANLIPYDVWRAYPERLTKSLQEVLDAEDGMRRKDYGQALAAVETLIVMYEKQALENAQFVVKKTLPVMMSFFPVVNFAFRGDLDKGLRERLAILEKRLRNAIRTLGCETEPGVYVFQIPNAPLSFTDRSTKQEFYGVLCQDEESFLRGGKQVRTIVDLLGHPAGAQFVSADTATVGTY